MKNTAKLLRVLGVFAITIVFFTVLTGCDKTDEPKPTPPPVIPIVSITTATALPSTTTFGGKSKITVAAKNANLIEVRENDENGKIVKSVSSDSLKFETDPLFAETKYFVVAKNGTQVKTTGFTIAVAEIHPELKLITDGHWRIIKNEEKEVWKNETEFTEKPVNPSAADNTYSFPNAITCVVDWGTLHSNADEKNGQTIYFEGYNPKTKEILWMESRPALVTTISTTLFVVDREIYTFMGTEKTILRQTYKNVK